MGDVILSQGKPFSRVCYIKKNLTFYQDIIFLYPDNIPSMNLYYLRKVKGVLLKVESDGLAFSSRSASGSDSKGNMGIRKAIR